MENTSLSNRFLEVHGYVGKDIDDHSLYFEKARLVHIDEIREIQADHNGRSLVSLKNEQEKWFVNEPYSKLRSALAITP